MSVVMSQPGMVQVFQETADSWSTAILAASQLRQSFPDFYAAHVAGRPATLELGLGCCCALWRLAETTHGVKLRWPPTLDDEFTAGTTPLEMLDAFDGVSEEYMDGMLGYYLAGPRPEYHGWNVQSKLTGEVAGLEIGRLTGLLWHLLSDTTLSVGPAGQIAQALERWDEDDRLDLLRIPPVARVDAGRLLDLVARDIPEAAGLRSESLLLRYALEATDNPLADTGDLDLETVHCGDEPEEWAWSELAHAGELQREAVAITEAFAAWRDRVEAGGLPALRQVAASFHRAARRLAREGEPAPKTLAELLGIEDQEEVPA